MGLPDPAQIGASIVLGGISQGMHEQSSMRLMDYQNRLYRENLADQRAYDAPSAVMARYRAAGLNPDLLLGQGASMSSGASQMGAAGSTGSPDFDGHLAAISAASLNQAQADNIQADTELKEAQAIDLENQARNRDEMTRIKDFESKIQDKLANSKIEVDQANIKVLANTADKLFEEIKGVKADVVRKEFENAHLQEKWDLFLQEMADKHKLSQAQIRNLNQQFEQSSQRFIKEMELVAQEIESGKEVAARRRYDDAWSVFLTNLMQNDDEGVVGFLEYGAGFLLRLWDKTLDRVSFGLGLRK